MNTWLLISRHPFWCCLLADLSGVVPGHYLLELSYDLFDGSLLPCVPLISSVVHLFPRFLWSLRWFIPSPCSFDLFGGSSLPRVPFDLLGPIGFLTPLMPRLCLPSLYFSPFQKEYKYNNRRAPPPPPPKKQKKKKKKKNKTKQRKNKKKKKKK